MTLNERRADILCAALQQFIKTGEPVSSAQLYEEHDFGIKPAMIRLELNILADEGFLEQPHHSSGRVPSDKGYEFFVEQILEMHAVVPAVDPVRSNVRFGFSELHVDETSHGASQAINQLFHARAWPDLLDYLSRELGVLGVLRDEEGDIYKHGLEHLVQHLEWGPRDRMVQVIEDYETIEDRIRPAEEVFGKDFLDIFIGSQSPITKSDDLAVVGGDYFFDNNRVMLFAIGPKRMDYQKATMIFKGLKK